MGQFDALKDDMDDDSNIMVTHDILKCPARNNRDGSSLNRAGMSYSTEIWIDFGVDQWKG